MTTNLRPAEPILHPGAAVIVTYPWDGDEDIATFVPDPDKTALNSGNVESITSTDGSFSLGNGAPAEQPAWGASEINGNPAYALNGTSGTLYSTDAALLAFGAGEDTPCLMWLLMNVISSASGDVFCGLFNTSSSNSSFRHIQAAASHRVDRATLNTSSLLQSVATGVQLFATYYDGTSVRFFRNGTEDGAGSIAMNAPSLTFHRYAVGANFNGTTTAANHIEASVAASGLVKGADALLKYQLLIEPWALERGGLA